MPLLALLLATLLVHSPPEWRLEDQFGRPHASADYAGTPVFLIAGGAPAAKSFDGWIDAVIRAYGTPEDSLPFRILGMADVGSAPKVTYPLIKLGLPRNRKRPVLIDPDGRVSAQYGADGATSNQIVLGANGAILLHLRGIPVDTAQARAIARRLRAAVDSTGVVRGRTK
jgi:hypothetical protein